MTDAFDALLFDLDGTLWDSTAAVTAGWNQALEQMGKREVTEADISGIMGLPHEEIFKRTFPEEDSAQREKIANAVYREELREIRKTAVGLYSGVGDGIEKLAARYPLFIVSNCLTDYLETFFAVTGMKPFFRDAICHGDTGMPKAENLKLLIGKHRLTAPAYIGDTAGDHNAALAAGAMYFHVGYGFGSPARECLTFATFAEVTDFFLK